MSSFPDLSRGIKKRHRTIFTPSQLRKLEEKFNECNFIVGEDRQLLAKQLKLKEHQVSKHNSFALISNLNLRYESVIIWVLF